MANSEKSTINFLARFKSLRIRGKCRNGDGKDEDSFIINKGSNDNSSNYIKSQKSIRKSLIKMHTRVKKAFQHNNNSNRNSIIAHSNSMTSSNSSPRVIEDSSNTPEQKHINMEEDVDQPSMDVSSHVDCLPTENLESSTSTSAPAVPPRIRRNESQVMNVTNCTAPKNEVANLLNYYWYWGPISKAQVDARLKDCPDGAFLVRDSLTDRYLFTLSFRSVGRLLHTRIEYSDSGYSFADQTGYSSVAELIEDAISKSRNSIYCYTKTKDDIFPNFPVRLTLPISRYDKVQSLKYLSRFVIRHYVNINDVEKLPLPGCLVEYLQENGQYF